YFRWVDDQLDLSLFHQEERLAFLKRQQALIDCGYDREWPGTIAAEEQMLFDLIASDNLPDSGLQAYIRHMMAVMAFDGERRGRQISQDELTAYSNHLAVAVTEALHYFIGHNDPAPLCHERYLAATGAHIVHMLRDTFEDAEAGYFNIPSEVL